MLTIDSALLEYMRDQAEALMTDTCLIEVRADARGEFGEATQETWTTVASGVRCRVITIQQSRAAQPVGTREALIDRYRLVCPSGTALDVDQRVTLSNGDVYQILQVVTARTSETDTQAIIERVR
jgi:hypothetical protein